MNSYTYIIANFIIYFLVANILELTKEIENLQLQLKKIEALKESAEFIRKRYIHKYVLEAR